MRLGKVSDLSVVFMCSIVSSKSFWTQSSRFMLRDFFLCVFKARRESTSKPIHVFCIFTQKLYCVENAIAFKICVRRCVSRILYAGSQPHDIEMIPPSTFKCNSWLISRRYLDLLAYCQSDSFQSNTWYPLFPI